MNRTIRGLAVAVTAATLTLAGVAQNAAIAKPAHAGTHAKGGKSAVAKSDVTKVVRDIRRTKTQIDRAVSEKRLASLTDAATAAAVSSNADLDETDLDELQVAATAADSTLDLKQVRRAVRAYRAENYRIVVNLLRHAAVVGATASDAGDAEATLLVESAVATALTVRATSPKSLLKQARADLTAAEELLDAEDIEDAEPEESEEEPDEAEPVTEPTDV